MFGTYRTLLALLVVLLHFAYIPLIGEYAVFGFFALSGFLMTLIMQRNYGYSVAGVGAFAVNRFLRIYPVYWVACAVSVIVLLGLPFEQTSGWNRNYFMPDTVRDWFYNLALVLRFTQKPSLVSPAWALTVELFFYACIGLGLSRTRLITSVWFLLSIAYTVWLLLTDPVWGHRYYTVGAASLPFATGAMIWHYREEIQAVHGTRYRPALYACHPVRRYPAQLVCRPEAGHPDRNQLLYQFPVVLPDDHRAVSAPGTTVREPRLR